MGAGTSTAGGAAGGAGQHSPPGERGQQLGDQDSAHREAAEGKPMQKNGQISSIHGKPEDQAEINGTSEQLNALQEGMSPIEVGQGEAVSQKARDKMEIDQEVAVHTNGQDEQKNVQEGKAQTGTDLAEQQEASEGAQAGEIGFKKVFKFVGFKFTVKKEKSVKSEPVQLLTVKKDEEVTAAEEGEESKPKGEIEGDHEVASAPEETPSEGSPPEVPSPDKAYQVTEQAATEADHEQTATESMKTVPATTEALETVTEVVETATEAVETATEAVEAATEVETAQTATETTAPEEPPKAAESPVSPVESNAAASPFKRFFKQGFFSGLRKKPSFKKTPEEMLVNEKTEMNAVKGSEGQEDKLNGSSEEGTKEVDQEAKPQPSTPEQKQDTADLQTGITAKGKPEKEADVGDLAPAPNNAVTVTKGKIADVSTEPAPVLSEADQIKPASSPVQQAEALPKSEATVTEALAPAESQPEKAAISQEKTTTEAIVNEVELLSSQEKAKLQGSPLKKLFTSSGIKKLSAKKSKGRKEETKPEEPDDAKMQMHSSTESEESPDGPKSESPLTSPEELPKAAISEVVQMDTTHVDGEGENGSTDPERRKEGVTAWASFKRLVTPKKHLKRPSESDKEDDQTEKAKTSTISSTESAASATSAASMEKPLSPTERQDESVPNAEEQKLERSTEDPRKKVDASVSWEALICVGSSKKRARKPSDPESTKPSEEMEKSVEESEAVQDHVVEEEVKTCSIQDTNQEPAGTSPERLESPVDEATEGTVSTWESFKRLVTPRRKSKSKLEERIEEPAVNVEAVPPEAEPVKEESWATFKKLIPGRRKRKSDTKPEHVQAETLTEVGENKSDEESETPAVVPLSEYIIIEQEANVESEKVLDEEKQPLVAETSQVAITGQILDERSFDLSLSKDVEPGAEGIPQVEMTPLQIAKICVDERSPSWISTKVCEGETKNETEEIAQQNGEDTEPAIQQVVVSATKTAAEIVHEVSHSEVAELAQEVVSEVVTAPEYPVEESFTEETEMVSAVSQLTETSTSTAEGTPLQQDVQSTKQTEDVLQEVAEKVQLSEDGVGPLTEMVLANGAPLEESNQEIGGLVEKDQPETVKESYDMSQCIKEETEKLPAVVEESKPTDESEANEDLQELGTTGKTAVKIDEIQDVVVTSILQEAETVPPIEVDALQGTVPVEDIQKKEAETVFVEKPIVPSKVAEVMVEAMPVEDSTIVVQEIRTTEVAQKLDTGLFEVAAGDLAKVGVEIVHEEILKSTSTKGDVEMKRAETLSEETMKATTVEKVEVENMEAVREATEVAATEVVRPIGAKENDAVYEQSVDATPAEAIETVTIADFKAVSEEMKPISSPTVGGEKTEATLSVEGVKCVDKELAAAQVAENIVEQAVKYSAETKQIEESFLVDKVVKSEVPEVEKVEKTKDVEQRLEQTEGNEKVKQTEETERMVVQIQVVEKVEQFEAPDKETKSMQVVEKLEQIRAIEKEAEQIKVEVTKAPEVTEKVELVEAPVIEKVELIEAPEVTEKVELVEAPVIEKVELIEAPEVTEKVELNGAPEITEKVEFIEAREVTEKVELVEAREVTEKVELVEAPEVTEKVELVEAPEITEKVELVEAQEVNEKVESIEAPEVTEKVEMIGAPEVTEKVELVEAPQVTEKVESVEAQEVNEKVESIEAPEVTEKVELVEAPQVTEKVESVQAPEVTEKVELVESPEVTEKVEKTEATEKLKQTEQEAVKVELTEAPEVTEKIESVEVPEVTEKVELVEAPEVTEKVEQIEATDKLEHTKQETVQVKVELIEAPEITEQVDETKAPELPEQVDQIAASKVTEKVIGAPEVTEMVELTKVTEKEAEQIKVAVTEVPEITERVDLIEAPMVTEKVEQTEKGAEQTKIEPVKASDVTKKVEETEVPELTEQMVEKVEQTDIIEVADKLERRIVALSGEAIEDASLKAEQVDVKSGVSCEEKVETTGANLVEQVAAETNGVAFDWTMKPTPVELAEQVVVDLEAEPEHEVGKPEPGTGTEMMQEKLEAVALQRVESEMVEATQTDIIQEVTEKIQTEVTEAVSEKMIEMLQESLGSTDGETQTVQAQAVTPTIPTVETAEAVVGEVELRASWEEPAVETEAIKPIDQLEAKPVCVTDLLLPGTEMEESKIAYESESLQRGTIVEEVVRELIEAAQTKPDEAEFIKEAVQPEYIKAETPEGHKGDAAEIPEATATAVFESPPTEAQVEEFKEPGLRLPSEAKQFADLAAKVCSASIEVQAAENEAATPLADVPVTKSSESREVAFPVAVAAIEEQVLAETTALIEAPVEAEVTEVIDQFVELDERIASTVQVSVAETAAAIVGAAIEAATGCFSDSGNGAHKTDLTPVVQQSIIDEPPEDPTECTDVAEPKIEFEVETGGKSSLVGAVEVQSTVRGMVDQQASMMVQGVLQSTVLTVNTVETVGTADAECVGKPTRGGETPEMERAAEAEQKIAERVQIPESLETKATEQVSIKEVPMPSTEIVLGVMECEQEHAEIRAFDSTEAKCKGLSQCTLKDMQTDEFSEDETTPATQSEVTEAEPCQSLQKSEEPEELTEIPKEPNVIIQPPAGTTASAGEMPPEILVAAKGSPTPELTNEAVIEANEDEQWEILQEEMAQEPRDAETKKQESQEAELEHQASLSSTLPCVQITAQQMPS